MHFALLAVFCSFVCLITAYDNVDLRNNLVPKNLFRPTVVVTSTSVSTITCSLSVANGCRRRKRDVRLHEEDNLAEQFPIAPSAVRGYVNFI